jgi:L-rhamnose-H+ transport protein
MFGMLWGLGFILWGKGLALTGISLGYTIAFGLVAMVGSVIPLLLASEGNDFSKANMVILSGILICLAGIIVSGIAGKNRETLHSDTRDGVNRKMFIKGLLFVILAGLFSGCLNIGFTYGSVIVERSISIYNNKPWIATLNIWLLLFVGCFVVSGSYTLILHIKNSSFRNYVSNNSGKDMMKILLMAVLHFLNLFLYGAGAYLLGKSGNAVGWAINFSLALMVANIFGILSGEWKGINQSTKVSLYSGVLLLVIGSVILGIGNNI